LPRRACTSCRKWFHPAPSAIKTQKTCGDPKCRAKRQAMLARQRRKRRLHESRVAERKRQRACRQRRVQRSERRGAPPGHAPSRATLHPEAPGFDGKLRAIVDHAVHVSRATLLREMRALLGENGSHLDHLDHDQGRCHAPASTARASP